MDADNPLRAKLAASYAALVGVNVVFGAGLFGVPTNAVVSSAYPTAITPAGFTFAIWGPIFLLEGAGVAVLSGKPAPRRTILAGRSWMACWAAECAWQFVFALSPLQPDAATRATKLMVFVPAALFLVAAQGSMLRACARLRCAPDGESGSPPRSLASRACTALAGAAFVDLPSGLNAGWLAAAAGIGISLVAQNLPLLSPLATPAGGAMLVSAVSGTGAVTAAVLGSKAKSVLVGVGYGAATAWACYGITKGETVPPEVKAAAARGIWAAACGVGVAVAGAALGALLSRGKGQVVRKVAKSSEDGVQKKPLLR